MAKYRGKSVRLGKPFRTPGQSKKFAVYVKDKKTKIPSKYLAGLSGSKRKSRASLLNRMSSIYKSGGRIPMSLLKRRTKI